MLQTLRVARQGVITGLALVVVLTGPATSPAVITTTTYQESTEVLVNPERGFFKQHSHCEQQPFDPERLKRYRTEEAMSLVRCVFYLPKSADIGAQIDELDAQATRVREGGMKMILRFAYTESKRGDDAPPARVQEHLDALKGTLRKNRDVIAVMESGFVGAWGEGYYTQNFGDRGLVDADDWLARNAVVKKLLRILPPGRKVVVRTPLMKWQFIGSEAWATREDSRSGTDAARVGHVNDCFLADEFDQGTYLPERRDDQYTYLRNDTRYVPMGGETCGKEEGSSRSECPTAREELRRFHYSYLNARYHPDVLASWTSDGCMEEVVQRLGYRFSLVSVTAPTVITRGTTIPFAMRVRNDGWSNPVNSRPVRLVLRSRRPAAKREYRFTLTDARRWSAQSTRWSASTVSKFRRIPSKFKRIPFHRVRLPSSMRPGPYDMLLSLADPSPDLAQRAAYAIQLANTGTWESFSGLNQLNRIVAVR